MTLHSGFKVRHIVACDGQVVEFSLPFSTLKLPSVINGFVPADIYLESPSLEVALDWRELLTSNHTFPEGIPHQLLDDGGRTDLLTPTWYNFEGRPILAPEFLSLAGTELQYTAAWLVSVSQLVPLLSPLHWVSPQVFPFNLLLQLSLCVSWEHSLRPLLCKNIKSLWCPLWAQGSCLCAEEAHFHVRPRGIANQQGIYGCSHCSLHVGLSGSEERCPVACSWKCKGKVGHLAGLLGNTDQHSKRDSFKDGKTQNKAKHILNEQPCNS